MKSLCAGFVAALVLSSAGPLPAHAQEGSAILVTSFNLLIGRPELGAGETNGTLLVSGTVLPVETGAEEPSGEIRLHLPADIPEKLRKALRLEQLLLRYSLLTPLELGNRTALRRPFDESTLELYVTLLGFNQDLATYRVEVLDAGQVLSDSNVGVRMGKRAVVGALDGEEAPYLFLVVGPQAAGALPPPPETLEPRLVEMVMAQYPREAKERKIEGTVIVQVRVQADGAVGDVEVVNSPSELLSRAAADAVSQWRYQAALDSEGNPTAIDYTVTLRFALR